jgi:hypothetical protein
MSPVGGVPTTWDPATGTLRTRLVGTVDAAAVRAWRDGLNATLAAVPGGSTVTLLLDLRGYEPADLDAHKAMRDVVPALLSTHGLRPAFLDLFDDPPPVDVTTARGVTVTAFANVHHDAEKMAEYERRIAKPNQRFFADRERAERWLASVGLPAGG